jgi:hypothetical protein
MSTFASTTNRKLDLFVVTIPWSGNNTEEGDYSDKVWATDEDAAILHLATEMADHPDAGEHANEEKRCIGRNLGQVRHRKPLGPGGGAGSSQDEAVSQAMANPRLRPDLAAWNCLAKARHRAPAGSPINVFAQARNSSAADFI